MRTSKIVEILNSANKIQIRSDERDKIIRLLRDGEDPNIGHERGRSALHVLIERYGDNSAESDPCNIILKELIRHGARLLGEDDILHSFVFASSQSWIEQAFLLQALAPKENQHNERGQNIIHVMAQKAPLIIWSHLKSEECKSEPHASWMLEPDHEGNTPLHVLWSEKGRMAQDAQLINQMDTMDPENMEYDTLYSVNKTWRIGVAITMKITEILKTKFGGNLDQTNHEGVSVMDLALQRIKEGIAVKAQQEHYIWDYFISEQERREIEQKTPPTTDSSNTRAPRL